MTPSSAIAPTPRRLPALSLAFLARSADNPLIAAIGRRTIGAVLG